VLYVRAGTYVEHLTFTKSGREGKPIVLSCAPGDLGRVKVTPSKEYVAKNPSGAVVTLQNIEHVWINGLVIAGPRGRPEAPRQETFGANGITWRGKGQVGLRATNNVIYGNVHCGLKEMDTPGVKVYVEGNVVFENGTEGRDHGIYCPADDMVLNGNIIFHNAGYGIHSYSQPQRQVITRNICLGNQDAGIILAGRLLFPRQARRAHRGGRPRSPGRSAVRGRQERRLPAPQGQPLSRQGGRRGAPLRGQGAGPGGVREVEPAGRKS
jgi:hypothetical protein